MSNPFQSPLTKASSSAFPKKRPSKLFRFAWVWLPLALVSVHTLVFVWWAGSDGNGIEGWGGILWIYIDFPSSFLPWYDRPNEYIGGLVLGGIQWAIWGLLIFYIAKFLANIWRGLIAATGGSN